MLNSFPFPSLEALVEPVERESPSKRGREMDGSIVMSVKLALCSNCICRTRNGGKCESINLGVDSQSFESSTQREPLLALNPSKC